MESIGVCPNVENGLPIITEAAVAAGSQAPTLGHLIQEGVIAEGTDINIGGLAHGTQAGYPTVWLVVAVKDGKPVFIETTLALFLTAADALKAAHGDPRT
jgi:hypothetical protein